MALCLITPAHAAPALWEVRDDNSALYVFGSIHVLPKDTVWRTQLFDDTLRAVDRVVFETDVSGAAMAEVRRLSVVRGIYIDGTMLTDVLDDAQEAKLRAHTTALNMPLGPMLAMRPWMAANAISAAALVASGFAGQGVELELAPEIDPGRLEYLETGAEQLDALAGAPEADQIVMLEGTLDELPTMAATMGATLESWLAGTPEQLLELLLSETDGPEAASRERMLYARNRNWMAPLEQMLAADDTNLIVVGAAHLVGDGSMLDLLERAGFRVQRIQ